MNVTVDCPSCKQQYQVDDSILGEEVECAVCQRVFVASKKAPIKLTIENAPVVPKEQQTQIRISDAKREEETTPVSTSSGNKKTKRNPSKRILFIGGPITIAVIVAIIALLYSNWNLIKATLGNADAQYKQGKSYIDSNMQEAIKWFQKSAEQGNVDAQHFLGEIFYLGWDVKKDWVAAFKWYSLAANSGDAVAQSVLGMFYEKGIAVKKDYDEAVKWYRMAAENDADTAERLAKRYEEGDDLFKKDRFEAIRLYRKAAELNPLKALFLASRYEKGDSLFQQDKNEAFKWFYWITEKEHGLAEYHVGRCYENGIGVKKNIEEAIKWYKKDEYGSSYALGRCYENGIGVEKDLDEAVKYYKIALRPGLINFRHEAKEALERLGVPVE